MHEKPQRLLSIDNMSIFKSIPPLRIVKLGLLILISTKMACTTQAVRFGRSIGRIIDGVNVTPKNKYPMIATINLDGGAICAGTILNKYYVLTAAHCAYYFRNVSDGEYNYTASAGIYYLGDPDPEYVQTVGVKEARIHPRLFDNQKGDWANDIAVIRLSSPFMWNDHVAPTNLPPPGWTVLQNKEISGIAVGWGQGRNKTYPHAPTRPLQEVTLPLLTTDSCKREWRNSSITDDQVCMGSIGGAGGCHGDSGGPLFYYNEARDSLIQIGVTSGGEEDCGLISEGSKPGIWTKVSKYLHWIEEITRECSPLRVVKTA